MDIMTHGVAAPVPPNKASAENALRYLLIQTDKDVKAFKPTELTAAEVVNHFNELIEAGKEKEAFEFLASSTTAVYGDFYLADSKLKEIKSKWAYEALSESVIEETTQVSDVNTGIVGDKDCDCKKKKKKEGLHEDEVVGYTEFEILGSEAQRIAIASLNQVSEIVAQITELVNNYKAEKAGTEIRGDLLNSIQGLNTAWEALYSAVKGFAKENGIIEDLDLCVRESFEEDIESFVGDNKEGEMNVFQKDVESARKWFAEKGYSAEESKAGTKTKFKYKKNEEVSPVDFTQVLRLDYFGPEGLSEEEQKILFDEIPELEKELQDGTVSRETFEACQARVKKMGKDFSKK